MTLTSLASSEKLPLAAPTGRVSTPRILGAAFAAGVAVYALIASGVLPPVVVLLLGAAAVALPPTAPTLVGRVALNGAMVVGWFPLTWWVAWPFPVDHLALLVAAGSAVIAATAAAGPSGRAKLRVCVAPVDLFVPAGGLLALVAMSRWMFPRSPKEALAQMLPGADNYPHFSMAAMLRVHGATLDALGTAPDGSPWAFFNYPQGFHSLAATLMEAVAPSVTRGPGLLVAYTRAEALLVVGGTMLVGAAVLTLPGLRSRPALALPSLTLAWAALLWEPGQNVLTDGFGNFWLGVVAVAVAHLLAVGSTRPLEPSRVGAVAGLVVAGATAWAPMAVLAAPAAVGLLIGIRRCPPSRQVAAATAAIAVAVALAGLRVLLLLMARVPVRYVVTDGSGGLHPSGPLFTLVLALATVYVGVFAPIWWRRANGDVDLEPALRVRVFGAAVLLGLILVVGFMAEQVAQLGTLTYYAHKVHLGLKMFLAAAAPAVGASLWAQLRPPAHRRTGVAAAAVATLLASQVLGPFPTGRGALHATGNHGEGTAGLDPSDSRTVIANGVLRAYAATRGQDTLDVDYFPLGAARSANPFYPDAWFHGLHGSLSFDVFRRYALWRHGMADTGVGAEMIRSMLIDNSNTRIVVDARYLDQVRRLLQDPSLAARVSGFGRPLR